MQHEPRPNGLEVELVVDLGGYDGGDEVGAGVDELRGEGEGVCA